MTPRLPASLRRTSFACAAALCFCLSAIAQDLLPRETSALAAAGRGDHHAAAGELLQLALATAADGGAGELAAARVEAWATRAATWLGEEPDDVFDRGLDDLAASPLARAVPSLRDRLWIVSLDRSAYDPRRTAAATADAAGCIAEFWLVGPFDNERGAGYRVALPPEQHFDLDAELTGKRRAVHWRRLPTLAPDRILPLDAIVHPHEQSLVYAAVAVTAAKSTPAVLELGTTGSFRVFCNGAEVGAREVERELRRDQDAVLLTLQPGANLLLLKLCHQEGAEFAATARLRALDGSPLPGVRCTTEPADLRSAASTSPAAPPQGPAALGGRSTLPIADGHGADALRCAWLWQALAADGDLERRDLAAAQRAAAELPKCAEAWLLVAAARTSHRRSEADRDDNERRRAFEQALATAPEHVEALVELGELLRADTGLWRQARGLADRALAVAPGHAGAQLLRIATQRDEGLDTATKVALRTAATAPTTTLALHREAADELADDDPVLALTQRLAVLATSHHPSDVSAAARHLFAAGRAEEARGLLDHTLASDPFAREARMQLVEHRLLGGDPRGALQLLEAWLAFAPDDADAMVTAARCWRQLAGKADDAIGQQIALLRSALEVEPNRRDEERYVEYLASAATGEAEPFYTNYRLDGRQVLAGDAGPPADAAAAHDALHWLLRQRVIRANGNGTTNEYVHQIARVLSEDGARMLAHFRLPYYGGEQRARLLSCAVTRPDGQVQHPTLRGAAVELPNLRPGDVVDLEGRIDDVAPSFFGEYFGLVHEFTSREGSPVRRSELVVLADPGRNYRVQSANGAPAEQLDKLPDGTLRYRWSATDLPRDVPELRRPERKEHEPLVRMTTYRDWDQFAHWYWNLIKNQLEVSPAMRATVQQLTAGLTDTDAKIAAIYRFVTTDVRYEAWEFGVHGYKPYSTAVIHERRHGDCKDKALLLCALLGEIGVPARPVLIFGNAPRTLDDLTLPMVQQFNHCIAWLPPHDGRPGRFLDGTATWHPTDTLPEMDQGARVLVVDEGRAELRDVPVTDPQRNRQQESYGVALRTDGGAEVAVEFRPLGNSAIELRQLIATETARRREQLERYLASVLGKLELRDVTASDGLDLGAPVVVSANAAVTSLGQVKGDRWELPSTWQYGDLQALASEAERRSPLLLGVPHGQHQTVRYRLPAGWRAGELPAPVAATTPFGAFSMRWSRDGDQLVVDRSLDFLVPRIAPAEYPAFRDFIATVKAADQRLVLLQKESNR